MKIDRMWFAASSVALFVILLCIDSNTVADTLVEKLGALVAAILFTTYLFMSYDAAMAKVKP